MGSLQILNTLASAQAKAELLKCCGSSKWADEVLRQRPFSDETGLFECAEEIWGALRPNDWLEAFSHHPRIGEKGLREKFEATAQWATQEQKGIESASEKLIAELATANQIYETKFGHVFLVCATGKSAQEMLLILKSRLDNDPQTELRIAANEQAKITRIRLEKWLKT